MSVVARAFRRMLALLVPTAAAALPASKPPQAATEATQPPPTFSFLARRIGADPAMRTRFEQDPRAVLREAGIDPEPFDVGQSLSDAEVARLVGRWEMAQAAGHPQALSQQQDPRRGSATPEPAPPPTPAPVYGPPPSLGRPSPNPPPPVRPQPPSPPGPPAPPAPVYGPPPGLR